MASPVDRGQRQVESILDWIAGADGVAFLVDVTGQSIVRGQRGLAAALVDDIAAAAVWETDVDTQTLPAVIDGRSFAVNLDTRLMPHGWVLGAAFPTADPCAWRARLERAEPVIARAIRPGHGDSGAPPSSSSGAPPTTASATLPARRFSA